MRWLLCAVLLAGCSTPSPTPSAPSRGLLIYTRNQSSVNWGYSFKDRIRDQWSRMGTPGFGTCILADPPWLISVGSVVVGESDSARDASFWIDISPDGQISKGYGRPDWSVNTPSCE
jgi:hypothetical protein